MSQLVVAALVIVFTVGGLLGAAAWNRTGTTQRVTLTERELERVQPPGADAASSAARLALRWQPRDDPQDARLWLGDSTLRELGFTLGLPAGASGAELFYTRSLPRTAWVAFEVDGPAWRLIEQRRPMMGGTEMNDSRLVPVAAGLDAGELRRRFEAQPVVVLPAVIRLRYERHPTRGPSVWADIERIDLPDITVPARLRESLRTGEHTGYELVLAVGRLGNVWLEESGATAAR